MGYTSRLVSTRREFWNREAASTGSIIGEEVASENACRLVHGFGANMQEDVIQQLTLEPLLTQEEEIGLAHQIANARKARVRLANGKFDKKIQSRLLSIIQDGTAAQERLVLANTRLVVSVAARYTGYNFSVSDLVQEGVVGLIRAIGKYDLGRGTRFSTHATWWIRQAISRYIENETRTIRLPVHMHVRVHRILRTSRELAQKLGRDPSDVEIGHELGLDAEAVREAKRVSRPIISLDVPQDENGNREFLDTYKNHETRSPEELTTQSLSIEQIFENLNGLSERDAYILMLRFGFVDGREHTLQEVGNQYGLTRERVRQIQHEALVYLRYQPNKLRELLTD